ncbi:hypothetical protein [Fischerella thermalis]|nr:hypothetical protein [Fischerella thermalis]
MGKFLVQELSEDLDQQSTALLNQNMNLQFTGVKIRGNATSPLN